MPLPVTPARAAAPTGAVQLNANRQEVVAQYKAALSVDAEKEAAAKSKRAEVIGGALSGLVEAYGTSRTRQAQADAHFDVSQQTIDETKANDWLSGEVYKRAHMQAASQAVVGQYVATRESDMLSGLASGMSPDEVRRADLEKRQKLQQEIRPFTSSIGPEGTAALGKQFQTIVMQQDQEFSAATASAAVAKATEAMSANLMSSVSAINTAANVGDVGAVKQVFQRNQEVISTSHYIPEAQRKQMLQQNILQAGMNASTSTELNTIIQAANDVLGPDALATVNQLNSMRGDATLKERIEMENGLNSDISSMTPDQIQQWNQSQQARIATAVQQKTVTVEQGAAMQREAMKRSSEATQAAWVTTAYKQGAPLATLAQMQGKSVSEIYKKNFEGAPLDVKIQEAKRSVVSADKDMHYEATKDIGKTLAKDISLMLSSPDGNLSEGQLGTLQMLQDLQRNDPELLNTILDGAGEEGADLRNMLSFGTVSADNFQVLRAQKQQERNLTNAGMTKTERNEAIAAASKDTVNRWFGVAGGWGAANKDSEWNYQQAYLANERAAAEIAAQDPRKLVTGGAGLIQAKATKYARNIQINRPGSRDQNMLIVAGPNTDIAAWQGRAGIRSDADASQVLSALIAPVMDGTQNGTVGRPTVNADGSVTYTIQNETGDFVEGTFEASEVQAKTTEYYKSKEQGASDFIENQMPVKPVHIAGQVLLMQAQDIVVDGMTIPANWTASVAQDLVDHEGYESGVYTDTKGNATWGIGFTKNSGITPEESNTPQKGLLSLQKALQGDYGKQVAKAMKEYGVPLNKQNYMALVEVGFQGPASMKQYAKAIGQHAQGKLTDQQLMQTLRGTTAYAYGSDSRQKAREAALVGIIKNNRAVKVGASDMSIYNR